MATWHAPLELKQMRSRYNSVHVILLYPDFDFGKQRSLLRAHHLWMPRMAGSSADRPLPESDGGVSGWSWNQSEAPWAGNECCYFSPERQDQEPWPCHPVVKPISWGMWSTHTATMTTSVPQAAASQRVTCFACSGGSHCSLRLVPSFWGKMSGKEPVSVVEGLQISQPGGCVFVLPSKFLKPENTAGTWQRKIEEKPSDPPWPWEHIQSWWMIIQFHQESATNPAELTFAVTSPASIISIACWKSAFAWMCCPIQKIYFNNK